MYREALLKYATLNKHLLAFVACVTGLISGAAMAQEDNDPARGIDEIVVTGRGGGSQIKQFESSVSITTFDETSIKESAPLTIAELFAEVPGVWAE